MTVQYTSMMRMAALLAVVMLLSGCAGAAVEPAAVAEPTESAVPDGVLRAREAVLAFLREGANECVPPKQAGWTAEAEPRPPAGYDVYRFHSGGCMMTITVPSASTEDIHYHVALGDGPTGFCWQAVVDSRGQILLTGNEAQTDTTLGNPAKTYCEDQGYTYEVITRPGGDLCGMCVFEDGLSCNAWAYFHGACSPDSAREAQP